MRTIKQAPRILLLHSTAMSIAISTSHTLKMVKTEKTRVKIILMMKISRRSTSPQRKITQSRKMAGSLTLIAISIRKRTIARMVIDQISMTMRIIQIR